MGFNSGFKGLSALW